MNLPEGPPERITTSDDFELSPAFSADGRFMTYASWNDETGGTIYRISQAPDQADAKPQAIYAAPTQLANPAFSADGSFIVFVQGSGATLRGQGLGSELRHDLYVIPSDGGKAEFVASTDNRGPNQRITRPVFGPDGKRIYYYETLDGTGGGSRGSRKPEQTGLVSVARDGTDYKVHLAFKYAQEAIPNPAMTHVAYTELHNAYVIPMPAVGKKLEVEAGSVVPVAKLSWDGGEWVSWADGGKTVTWSFGPEFKRLALDKLEFKTKPAERPKDDPETIELSANAKGSYSFKSKSYSISSLKKALAKFEDADPKPKFEITIDDKAPFSVWKELKDFLEEKKLAFSFPKKDDDEADDKKDEEDKDGEKADKPKAEAIAINLTVPRARPKGTIALVGARIITMKGDQVIEEGTILVIDDRISAVGKRSSVKVPSGAKVIDVEGKTIIPVLVDVHAHMGYGVLDVNPQREWRYYANLAYGVTTTHDPSASTHTVFGQGEMVEAGLMVGPRIYSTGFILYGAVTPDMAPISSYEDALSHVRRLKSLGAFSVKSYMQPRREQRQWVIKAAREEKMLVVPEGGGDFPVNMGLILDGHTGIAHALWASLMGSTSADFPLAAATTCAA